MSVLYLTFYLVFIFIFSVIVTGLVRRYSLRKALIDIPNERSSHQQPTPRGGGLSIVLSMLVSLVFIYYMEWIGLDVVIALGGGGLIVAVAGWLDDHRHISPLIRGLIYTIASIWTIYFLGGLYSLKAGEYLFILPVLGNILAIVGLVWMTNLYNFMDGTDALAAIQAICAGIFLGLLFLHAGDLGLAGLCFILVAASGGFLLWNWPPAKIFMGDVGSCFTGFCFASLAIIGEKTQSATILVCFILLSLFVCDATLTLFMRILKREKWYSAHRSHAYQRLVQMGMSHARLAMGFLAINIMMLWPMAYIAHQWQQLSSLMVFLTLLFICSLWGYIQYCYGRYAAMGR